METVSGNIELVKGIVLKLEVMQDKVYKESLKLKLVVMEILGNR